MVLFSIRDTALCGVSVDYCSLSPANPTEELPEGSLPSSP